MLRRVIICLLVSSCGGDEALPVMTKLDCNDGVKCNIYEWHLGMRRFGPNVAGTHIKCVCIEKEKE